MLEGYNPSTAQSLDHYFGNKVGIARIWHIDKDIDVARDFGKVKRDFVAGLERAIKSNLPEYRGVTNQHLREMIQLAQSGDWSDVETVKALYIRYDQIRESDFDIPKLFREE